MHVPAFAAVLAASLAIATPKAAATVCPGADSVPSVASIAAVKGATLCLLNNQRAAHGLAPLADQPTLASAATTYSQAMVDQRFFDHVSPSGENLERRLRPYISGTQTWNIGENLAWGTGGYATPSSIVEDWMHSAEHRTNILDGSYREIGIGIVTGVPVESQPGEGATYTTEFGSRVMSKGASKPGAAGPASAVAASTPDAKPKPAAPTPVKRVSSSKKRQITATCARVARRTKSSATARKARVARCVRDRLRAAGR